MRLKNRKRLGIESLEARMLLAADLVDRIETDPPISGDLQGVAVPYYPTMLAGDPNGNPVSNANTIIDPNLPTSEYAGVVALEVRRGSAGPFTCSGTLVTKLHVLTAAHCLTDRFDGGLDINTTTSAVVFNHQQFPVRSAGFASVAIHPDWTGVENEKFDDLAIIELASPAPAEVPTYQLHREETFVPQEIHIVGYGDGGNGVQGASALVPDSTTVKRAGRNWAYDVEFDLPSLDPEAFGFDFDGPTLETNTMNDDGTLGNNVEVQLAEGDSGGPSFVWHDANGDGDVDASELEIFGVNTFVTKGSADSRFEFGATGGGMLVSKFFDFIDQNTSLSWHNSEMPADVDKDGAVTPLDALTIINELNHRDVSDPMNGILPDERCHGGLVIDVDNDGFITPLDALLAINELPGNPQAALSNIAAGPSHNLGEIDVAALPSSAISGGFWIEWAAINSAPMSINALFDHSQGDLDLTLYATDGDYFNDLQSPVAEANSANDNEVIQVNAAAGERFLLYVRGSHPEVSFTFVNSTEDVILVNQIGDTSDWNLADGVADASPAAGQQVTLRAAIEQTQYSGGDATILLPAGVYSLSNSAKDFDLSSNIRIVGAGMGSSVINANGISDRIFEVVGSELHLQNLTLTGGSSTSVGGAVWARNGAHLTLDGVAVVDNRGSQNGGALYISASTADISNSVITDNTLASPSWGGAGLFVTGSQVSMTGTVVATNRVDGWAVNDDGNNIFSPSANFIDSGGGNLVEHVEARLVNVFAGEALGTTNNVVTTLRDEVNSSNDTYSLSLREALRRPGNEYRIAMPAQHYYLDHADRDIELQSTSHEVIGSAMGDTIIDATFLGDRIFEVHSGSNLSLKGLTVTGGWATNQPNDGVGGAVWVHEQGGLVGNNVAFVGNTASNTGGAITNWGTAQLFNSVVTDNRLVAANSYGGGGIYSLSSATTLQLYQTIVANNHSNAGEPDIFAINGGTNTINAVGNRITRFEYPGIQSFFDNASNTIHGDTVTAVVTTVRDEVNRNNDDFAFSLREAIGLANVSGISDVFIPSARFELQPSGVGSEQINVSSALTLSGLGRNLSVIDAEQLGLNRYNLFKLMNGGSVRLVDAQVVPGLTPINPFPGFSGPAGPGFVDSPDPDQRVDFGWEDPRTSSTQFVSSLYRYSRSPLFDPDGEASERTDEYESLIEAAFEDFDSRLANPSD